MIFYNEEEFVAHLKRISDAAAAELGDDTEAQLERLNDEYTLRRALDELPAAPRP